MMQMKMIMKAVDSTRVYGFILKSVAGVAGVAGSFYNIYFYMCIYITHHISRKL